MPSLSIILSTLSAQVSEAQKARESGGITLIAVGVGGATQMSVIASPPISKTEFYARSFAALPSIADAVSQTLCSGWLDNIFFVLRLIFLLSIYSLSFSCC